MVIYELVNIRVHSINGLDTGWITTLKKMVKFVKFCWKIKGMLTLDEINDWSIELYQQDLTEKPENFSRINNFIHLILSIKKLGYLYYMDMKLDDLRYEIRPEKVDNRIWYREIFSVPISGILPRVEWIKENNCWRIDDGRHRLSILMAMGVEKTPMVTIRTLPTKSRKLSMKSSKNFGIKLIERLGDYSLSSEWNGYKKGDDYNKTSSWKWIKTS